MIAAQVVTQDGSPLRGVTIQASSGGTSLGTAVTGGPTTVFPNADGIATFYLPLGTETVQLLALPGVAHYDPPSPPLDQLTLTSVGPSRPSS